MTGASGGHDGLVTAGVERLHIDLSELRPRTNHGRHVFDGMNRRLLALGGGSTLTGATGVRYTTADGAECNDDTADDDLQDPRCAHTGVLNLTEPAWSGLATGTASTHGERS